MATGSTTVSNAIDGGIDKTTKEAENAQTPCDRAARAALGRPPALVTPSWAADPAPVIDNERVRVFDTTAATPSMPDDFVAITFDKGTAVYGRAGDAAGVPGVRTVIIDLKNHPVPPLANNSGYPNAYPRPHIDKLLENDRVIVWHYRWFLNDPTPMHFHDKDVVVAYLEDRPCNRPSRTASRS